MAKINGNNIKPGMVLEHNKGLWVVTKASHVKQSDLQRAQVLVRVAG